MSSSGAGRAWGSVSQRRGLQGPSLLPPLQKQRVGCVFNLLYLDLLIVDTHRGQGTGHLLLKVAGREFTPRDTEKGKGEGGRGREQMGQLLRGPELTAAPAPGRWAGPGHSTAATMPEPPGPPARLRPRHWRSGGLGSGLPQPVISCVPLSRSLPLSGPRLPHLQNQEMVPDGLSGPRDSRSRGLTATATGRLGPECRLLCPQRARGSGSESHFLW